MNYFESFKLTGKTAMVTGGVGILGRHFCQGLAEAGANIIVVDQNAAECEAFAKELSQKHGGKAIGIACDLADEKSILALMEKAVGHFGKIHILHNNAASKTNDVKNFFKETRDFDMADWRDVMSVNVDGVFMLARLVGEHMLKNKIKGSIIQTGSIYGIMAPDLRIYEGSQYLGTQITSPAVYSVSKAAIVGLTRYLASLWGSAGIRVNTLIPGGVQSGQNDTFVQKYSARIPMGRMAEAHEMVGPLIFLASDASSYVTGQTLVVDGGLSAW